MMSYFEKPDFKATQDELNDMCGETRICFDDDGNYIGPPSPSPAFLFVAILTIAIFLMLYLVLK